MSVPVNNNFGVLLAQKRKAEKRNIPLAEIADEIEVSRKTLYAWQNNTVDRFDANVIEKLCRYFGVELSELLELVPRIFESPELSPTKINNKKPSRK
jgi:DNA-binding Xre family transcriptional regulator